MAHTYADVESLWRECYLLATEQAAPFLTTLTNQWRHARRLNAAGSLASVSKNSASQSSAFGGTSTITTLDMERAAMEAMRLYERLALALDTTVEADIYTEGLFQLANAPTEAFPDIWNLRCA